MLCDKMPDNQVFRIRSDKNNGSKIEAFDVEEDRKTEYIRMVEELERYINEDFDLSPEIAQGNIRKIFEIVLKTKYYRPLAAEIKGKKGLSTLLNKLFADGHLNTALKSQAFDLCSLTNSPHHGELVSVPSKQLTRGELIPLIQQSLILLEKL